MAARKKGAQIAREVLARRKREDAHDLAQMDARAKKGRKSVLWSEARRALTAKPKEAAKRARPSAESERLRKLAIRVETARVAIRSASALTTSAQSRETLLSFAARDLANAVEYLAAGRWKGKAKK